ncbi:MAG TPA: HlyD family efflux transporter periplasmic adaptor subunit [Verrucomicrobiae bacterium]|nr:HlyD family efflux transporter periplasmic adaptor subunit [Verrucomicrobiae bacterium]
MKLEPLKPVPTPLPQRLRDLRMRFIPPIVCIGAMLVIGLVWKDTVSPPTMVGQAEPIVSNISSYQPGILAELTVRRFERVRAGQVIGKVLVAHPELLSASLDVIRSEIEELQTDPQRLYTERRYAVDFAQLRQNWMRHRVDLASAKANLQFAEAELLRHEKLLAAKMVSQTEYDLAKSNRDSLVEEVNELTQLVNDGQIAFDSMQGTNWAGNATESGVAAWQEARLRLAAAELQPIILTAPIDGIITVVSNHPGESVSAGTTIVTIASLSPVRIVGYLKTPFSADPQPGARVAVRTRGIRRQVAETIITEVGTQLELLPMHMQSALRFANLEIGLPVEIELPPELKLRAGELVDISIITN